MVDVLTQEELKKLSPDARIKKLRELEEGRKKELEEARKQVEQELAAAEELIKKTEDEIDEEAVLERLKEAGKKSTEEVEESLEQKLAKEQVQAQPQGEQYRTNDNIYTALERTASELERLYNQPSWNDRDRQLYNQAKEDIAKIQTYTLTSEKLAEEFGLASSVLNRLKYKN